MFVLTNHNFHQVLQACRKILLESDGRLQSIAHEGDLEMLHHETALIRSLLTDSIKKSVHQLSHDELIELQTQSNSELDERLYVAVKTLVEQRTQSLAEQAQRDPLTMLLNRAAFDGRLSDEVERARRYRRELSLVLFDIDSFKSINDRLGHPAGDKVLIEVSNILQLSLRQSDAAFRYGGDEFAAICPETSGDAVLSVLHRIEVSLRKYGIETRLIGHLGISWGVASFPIDAIDAGELINVADERLYECKREHHRSLSERS